MVEIIFGIITRQAIRRGTFTSVKDLTTASPDLGQGSSGGVPAGSGLRTICRLGDASSGEDPLHGLAGEVRDALVVGVVVQDDETGRLGARSDE
jgi:hypothetical protein